MSLSRLSEKCKNCPKVYVCDKKRMEACGYLTPSINIPIPKFAEGGLPKSGMLFAERGNMPGMVGRFPDSGKQADMDKITVTIKEAIYKAMCGVMEAG